MPSTLLLGKLCQMNVHEFPLILRILLIDLRAYVEEQWADDDFGVLKEDFKNADFLVRNTFILC